MAVVAVDVGRSNLGQGRKVEGLLCVVRRRTRSCWHPKYLWVLSLGCSFFCAERAAVPRRYLKQPKWTGKALTLVRGPVHDGTDSSH
jgi:hypothetical protein